MRCMFLKYHVQGALWYKLHLITHPCPQPKWPHPNIGVNRYRELLQFTVLSSLRLVPCIF